MSGSNFTEGGGKQPPSAVPGEKSPVLLGLKAKDINIFIVLSERPLNARKIAFYRFLIPFLVPELLRFKDLKNDLKLV